MPVSTTTTTCDYKFFFFLIQVTGTHMLAPLVDHQWKENIKDPTPIQQWTISVRRLFITLFKPVSTNTAPVNNSTENYRSTTTNFQHNLHCLKRHFIICILPWNFFSPLMSADKVQCVHNLLAQSPHQPTPVHTPCAIYSIQSLQDVQTLHIVQIPQEFTPSTHPPWVHTHYTFYTIYIFNTAHLSLHTLHSQQNLHILRMRLPPLSATLN